MYKFRRTVAKSVIRYQILIYEVHYTDECLDVTPRSYDYGGSFPGAYEGRIHRE